MALTPTLPTLKSIEDLFGKLEREAHRAWRADKEIGVEQAISQTDHFYNFCVTAHAMRDYFFEARKIVKDADKQSYRKKWDKDKILLAATKIANASKHFRLRDRKTGDRKEVKTNNVEPTTREAEVFQLTVSDEKMDFQEKSVIQPDLIIELENGEKWDLWNFKAHIIDYWAKCLRALNPEWIPGHEAK